MTDRELLELAAKAAGIEIATWSNSQAGGFLKLGVAEGRFWNPLTDAGDRYELMKKLKLEVNFELGEVSGPWFIHEKYGKCKTYYAIDSVQNIDQAIVEAAARIGKDMK